MILNLSPVRCDEALSVARAGDVLTVNGVAFDFSQLPEGAVLPAEAIASEWFVGPVERIDGELHVTLRLPHGPIPSPEQAAPQPISVIADGPVALPQAPAPEPAPLLEGLGDPQPALEPSA